MSAVEKALRHPLVQPLALALGQAAVDDVLERRVAHAPALQRARLLVADEDLGVLELLHLLSGCIGVDDPQLVQVERVPEDRPPSRQVAQSRRHGVKPRADDSLDRRRHGPRSASVRAG